MIIPSSPGGPNLVLKPLKPISYYKNITLSFGYRYSAAEPDWDEYPSSGWVWTKGSNGVISWTGDTLWGNLGNKQFNIWKPPYFIDFCLVCKGAIEFTGIRIGGLVNCIFIGTTLHTSIVNEFPDDK